METDIKYARSGDAHIAYRVVGDGPRDIVLVPGTISHLELLWEVPTNKYLIQRLTSYSRVILFDKRGQGLSDRVGDQTLKERIGDLAAVMDAAGSERATVYGWSEGGPISLKFAATYPERTSALVIYGSFASISGDPWAVPAQQYEDFLALLERKWGTGVLVRMYAQSHLKDEALVQWFGRIERESASPASIIALMRASYKLDVRNLLPSIRVPTLILHRVGDALVPVIAGRYMAENIPGAVFHEIPGKDHLVLDHDTQDHISDLIEKFVARHPEPARAATRTCDQSVAQTRAGRAAADLSRKVNGASGRKPALTRVKPSNVFRNEGDFWTVSYDGRTYRLKDSKGMRYLALLLAHPYREFHATALAAGSERKELAVGDSQYASSSRGAGVDQFLSDGLGDAGEILDVQAKAAYRRRIKDLTEELEKAKRIGDEKRGLRVDEELEALSAELARAVGLGGRDRRAASIAERARVNVTRTIRISIGRIKEHHTGLAKFLDTAIHTGTFCSYQPDPERHIFWNL